MKTIFDQICLFDILWGIVWESKGQRHFTGELINILSAEGIANRYVCIFKELWGVQKSRCQG